MYFNGSVLSLILTLKSLELPETGIYPAFIFGATTYLIILLCNLTIVLTICLNRNLHKPMYILLLNMPINDIMVATTFFPQLLYSILFQDRLISYPACFLQGFFIHLYGGVAYLTLTVMAYDRYIAICWPLRYSAIMTNAILVRITVALWLSNAVVVFVIFALLMPYRFCETHLADLVCYNPPLMKVVCESTRINNIYGLFSMILYHSISLSTVAFTYIRILITCVTNKQSDAKLKAIQTCGTHLVVFLFLEINTLVPLLSYRFENVPAYLHRVLSISIFVFPPIVNPLVYGFKTKEIRQKIDAFLKRKINSV